MESTIPDKLKALEKLQTLDSQIGELQKIRGALPEEISDLEDEIARFQTRIHNQNEEKKALEVTVNEHLNNMNNAEQLIVKYKEQQDNVRNDREYNALNKEIELQELEILLLEKRNKETKEQIQLKEQGIEETQEQFKKKSEDLEIKKSELIAIQRESESDEEKIKKTRNRASKHVEARLLKSYTKIRGNMRNGLAVVQVRRGACGGCFNIVPPQKQAEIRLMKKIIVCEFCGRIFSNVADEIINEIKPVRKYSRRDKKQTNTK